MQKVSVETQLVSGMHGGATGTAHLSSTSPFAFSMLRNKTVFQLYVDVVSALASLCRKIALPDDLESEESWRRHLVNCRFSGEDVEEIITLACTGLTWSDAGATAHDLAMLHEAYVSTWFSIEGLKHVT